MICVITVLLFAALVYPAPMAYRLNLCFTIMTEYIWKLETIKEFLADRVAFDDMSLTREARVHRLTCMFDCIKNRHGNMTLDQFCKLFINAGIHTCPVFDPIDTDEHKYVDDIHVTDSSSAKPIVIETNADGIPNVLDLNNQQHVNRFFLWNAFLNVCTETSLWWDKRVPTLMV